MDAQQIGEACGRAVQWAGLLGLGGVALAALALSLARLRRSFRACPPLRRALAVLAVAVAVAYAETKPEATVGSSTNRRGNGDDLSYEPTRTDNPWAGIL